MLTGIHEGETPGGAAADSPGDLLITAAFLPAAVSSPVPHDLHQPLPVMCDGSTQTEQAMPSRSSNLLPGGGMEGSLCPAGCFLYVYATASSWHRVRVSPAPPSGLVSCGRHGSCASSQCESISGRMLAVTPAGGPARRHPRKDQRWCCRFASSLSSAWPCNAALLLSSLPNTC